MASYQELWALFTDAALAEKVAVACAVAAEKIRTEDGGTTNHANRMKWAKRAFNDPNTVKGDMQKALLAANRALTVVQITGASDTAIQDAVDAAVNVFADGE